jgi:D-tyrosyl-tRNA(Tyr) deacylase
MRAVVQRVTRAAVRVDGAVVGRIHKGYVVLLGVTHGDTSATGAKLAAKIVELRLFDDADGRMNLSLAEAGGEVLCVSQFTLYGDVRRGRRPSWDAAAPGEEAKAIYEAYCASIEALGIHCERGVFGAEMQVELANDGPVTLILDSADLERPRRA